MSSFFLRFLSSCLQSWLLWFYWSLTLHWVHFFSGLYLLISSYGFCDFIGVWLDSNSCLLRFLSSYLQLWLSWFNWSLIGSCFLRFLSSYLQLWLLLLFHWNLTGQQVHVAVSSGFCLLISIIVIVFFLFSLEFDWTASSCFLKFLSLISSYDYCEFTLHWNFTVWYHSAQTSHTTKTVWGSRCSTTVPPY